MAKTSIVAYLKLVQVTSTKFLAARCASLTNTGPRAILILKCSRCLSYSTRINTSTKLLISSKKIKNNNLITIITLNQIGIFPLKSRDLNSIFMGSKASAKLGWYRRLLGISYTVMLSKAVYL